MPLIWLIYLGTLLLVRHTVHLHALLRVTCLAHYKKAAAYWVLHISPTMTCHGKCLAHWLHVKASCTLSVISLAGTGHSRMR